MPSREADVTAAFDQAGDYTFNCTMSDGGQRTLDSHTTVTVVQTASQLLITREPVILGTRDRAYIKAQAQDRFGNEDFE